MTTILIKKKDTAGAPAAGDLTNAAGGAEIAVNTATKRVYSKDSGGTVIEMGTFPSTMAVQGALSATGNVTLGDAAADNVTVNGTITSNLIFTDATYDIGASGANRPRDLFLSRNLTVGGTLTLAGGVNLNGNVTVGDASTDTLTINSTITSNLIFTDNTYDIGASGATRPRTGYFGTSIFTPLLDATNVEVSNIKALDGTAAITIASSTGAVAVSTNVTLGDATTDTVTVNGYMGIGGAADSQYGLYVQSSALTGTNQRGIFAIPTATSAATSTISSIFAYPKTAAAAFTVTTAASFRADDAVKGAGSTITNLAGVYVADQTQGTNNYGVLSQVTSGTNKFNIYASGTAANYFAGTTGVGTLSVPAVLNVGGNISSVYNSAGATGSFGKIGFTNSYSNAAAIHSAIQATNDGVNTTGLAFLTSSTGNDGAERMRITSAGNVGIGTASPVTLLDVRSGYITAGTASSVNGSKVLGGYYSNGNIATFGTEYSNGSPVMGYGVWPSTAAASSFVSSTGIAVTRGAYTIFGNSHIWYAGAVQTVAVDGAVTTAEIGRFDINGGFLIGTTTNTNSYKLVALDDIAIRTATDASGSTNLRLGVSASMPQGIALLNGTKTAVGAGDMRFSTATGGVLAERMRLLSTGYFGINTTSPNFLAHISTGSTTSITQPTANSYGLYIQQNTSGSVGGIYIQDGASNSGASLFIADNNNAARFVVGADGAVGIGSSPVAGKVLTVTNTGADASVRINAPTGYYSYLELTENSSLTAGEYWQIGKIPTTHALQFWNGSERARITSAGVVLVNTTSTYTNTQLNVNGDINATRFHSYFFTETRTGSTTFYFYGNASSGAGNFNYANFGTGDILEVSISSTGASNEAGCIWTGWTDGDAAWLTMSSYTQGQLGSFSFATGTAAGPSGYLAITWNPNAPANSVSFWISIRRVNRNSN